METSEIQGLAYIIIMILKLYFQYWIGETNLLYILLAFGSIIHVGVAILLVKFDNKNALRKICMHHSEQEIEIIAAVSVSFISFYLF